MDGNNGPMNANQIMHILNQNPLMKSITYSLIQNPMIISQMMNIINSLYNNPLLMNEIKNNMNQENIMMNMMNMNMGFSLNMNNTINPMANNVVNNMEKQETISIILHKGEHGERKLCPLVCKLDEKMSSVMENYRRLYNDKDKNIKFIFNAKVINPSVTVDEVGLKNNSRIFVIAPRVLG